MDTVGVRTVFGEEVRASSFIGGELHAVRWKQSSRFLQFSANVYRGCVWKLSSQRDGLCHLLTVSPLAVYVNSNPSVPRLVLLELGGVCAPGARNLGWRANLRILPPTI